MPAESEGPIRTGALWGSLAAMAVVTYFANTGQRWVPVLDHANLIFHEAGHLIVGIFSWRLSVYGGTLAQLAFPVITSIYFWRKRQPVPTALCLFWLMQNLWNISRYLGDAQMQLLPLVGGDHDWTEILKRWGLLTQDHRIARALSRVANVGAAVVALGLVGEWRLQNKKP